MTETRTGVLVLTLMGVMVLLMVSILGLFVRMNQLQGQVLAALAPLQMLREPGGLAVGREAPEFNLPDSEGRMVSLTGLSDKRVLLQFSSSHCPACQQVLPEIKRFREQRPDVQVLMICRGSAEEIQQWSRELGCPILVWQDSVAQEYAVTGIPFFYVIDRGVIVNKGRASRMEELTELVRVG